MDTHNTETATHQQSFAILACNHLSTMRTSPIGAQRNYLTPTRREKNSIRNSPKRFASLLNFLLLRIEVTLTVCVVELARNRKKQAPHGNLRQTEANTRNQRRQFRINSLAINDFTYFFTFFSKFFSSFPHGTCSLSVSSEYLALEGYYLPFCAAVPSNTTLRMRTVTGVSRHGTRLLRSSEGCLNNHLRASATCRYAPLDHNSHGTRPGIFGLSCSRFTRRYWGNPC